MDACSASPHAPQRPLASAAGDPSAPSGAAISNSATASDDVVILFDAPAADADLAAGYYLKLKYWTKGADAAGANVLPVTLTDGGSDDTITVLHGAVNTNPDAANKWQVTVDRTTLFCGPAACGDGKFQLAEFGAISRFEDTAAGAAVAPANGQRVAQANLPAAGVFAYYGEQGAPPAGQGRRRGSLLKPCCAIQAS